MDLRKGTVSVNSLDSVLMRVDKFPKKNYPPRQYFLVAEFPVTPVKSLSFLGKFVDLATQLHCAARLTVMFYT